MELKGKFFINGKIEVKTGLHIGGSKETLEIGGLDNPVIRTKDGKVYIPGSSLKGKIRSLLEQKEGKSSSSPCECGTCDICKIFGPHKSENITEPVRIIVRDAYAEGENIKTERKIENIIDRVRGTAISPREIERVPAGTKFDFEIIFNVYKEDDIKLINKFVEGMKLLEDDYLGGSGSRGYGKIEFKEINCKYRQKEYYEGNSDKENSKENVENIDKLQEILKDKNSISEFFNILPPHS